MLSNAYFLAKFRFDTAENEPAKNLQNFANFPHFANPNDHKVADVIGPVSGASAASKDTVGPLSTKFWGSAHACDTSTLRSEVNNSL